MVKKLQFKKFQQRKFQGPDDKETKDIIELIMLGVAAIFVITVLVTLLSLAI